MKQNYSTPVAGAVLSPPGAAAAPAAACSAPAATSPRPTRSYAGSDPTTCTAVSH